MRTVLLSFCCVLLAACSGLNPPTAEQLEHDAAIRSDVERCLENKPACYGALITDTEGRICVVTLEPGTERHCNIVNLEYTQTRPAGFSNLSDITFRSDPEWEAKGAEYMRQQFPG